MSSCGEGKATIVSGADSREKEEDADRLLLCSFSFKTRTNLARSDSLLVALVSLRAVALVPLHGVVRVLAAKPRNLGLKNLPAFPPHY